MVEFLLRLLLLEDCVHLQRVLLVQQHHETHHRLLPVFSPLFVAEFVECFLARRTKQYRVSPHLVARLQKRRREGAEGGVERVDQMGPKVQVVDGLVALHQLLQDLFVGQSCEQPKALYGPDCVGAQKFDQFAATVVHFVH